MYLNFTCFRVDVHVCTYHSLVQVNIYRKFLVGSFALWVTVSEIFAYKVRSMQNCLPCYEMLLVTMESKLNCGALSRDVTCQSYIGATKTTFTLLTDQSIYQNLIYYWSKTQLIWVKYYVFRVLSSTNDKQVFSKTGLILIWSDSRVNVECFLNDPLSNTPHSVKSL